jgi:uncharacterized repeat protein (TIGR01451 family)
MLNEEAGPMIGGHRVAILALLTVCAVAWIVVPVRTTVEAQQDIVPVSPEPPLVEGAGPGVPGDVVDPPPPVVAVRVRVPARGTAGQELTYRIVVANTSRSAAHRVALRAELTNADFVRATPEPEQKEPELRWTFGTLEGGATREISLVAVPNGKGEARATARVSFEHGQSVVTHLNRPSLRLRKSGPSEAAVKSEIRYVLDVVNDGSAVAENVVVTDVLPDGLKYSETPGAKEVDERTRRWEFARLAPGESKRLDYKLITDKEGRYTNKATAAATGVAPVEATATLAVGQPKLTIAKAGPAVGDPGQPLAYTITVTNTGTVAANNVEIRDQVPQDRMGAGRVVDFLGASAGGRYEAPFVRWPVGQLAPGASRTVQLTVRVNQAGRLNNVAEVRAEQVAPDKAEALTVIVDPSQRLYLDIDRQGETLEAGRKATFIVRVINTSRNAAVKDAALTFSASDNVRFVEARGAAGDRPEADKPPLRFASVAALEPRRFAEYQITLEATQAGEAEFRATVETNPPLPGKPAQLNIRVPIRANRP